MNNNIEQERGIDINWTINYWLRFDPYISHELLRSRVNQVVPLTRYEQSKIYNPNILINKEIIEIVKY